ncbi:glycosyltransferase family 2 protein [bacterium]|nr:glycosyltransferase family 2 protein [bacterium]
MELAKQSLDLSVVIPVKNERENIEALVEELLEVLRETGRSFEVLFIDDGSDDGTVEEINRRRAAEPAIKLVRFDRNYGKSAALKAGFQAAEGEIVIIMDGDRQNDPVDIPRFLEAIEGFDIVCGVRRKRLDTKWRLIQSRIANRIRDAITGDGVRDSGCGYQALRRACLKDIKLFEGMHRFLPCLFQLEGYRFNQIPVMHHPRTAGVSKYPFWSRLRRAFVDLLAVRWMINRTIRYKIRRES